VEKAVVQWRLETRSSQEKERELEDDGEEVRVTRMKGVEEG